MILVLIIFVMRGAQLCILVITMVTIYVSVDVEVLDTQIYGQHCRSAVVNPFYTIQ